MYKECALNKRKAEWQKCLQGQTDSLWVSRQNQDMGKRSPVPLLSVFGQRNNATCTAEKALLQNGYSNSEYILVALDKPSLSLLTEGYMSWQVSGDRVAQTENIFVAVSANRPFCFLMALNISFVIQASCIELAEVWWENYPQNISTCYLYVLSSGMQSIWDFLNQNRSGKKLHQTTEGQ